MKEHAEMSDIITLSGSSTIELDQEMVGPELAMLEGLKLRTYGNLETLIPR